MQNGWLKTGLASIPVNISPRDPATGLVEKQCNFVRWSPWKTTSQTVEELLECCNFIVDNKCNAWAQLMGKMTDRTHRFCIDYDTKKGSSEAITLGKKFLDLLPQDTRIEQSANSGGLHQIYDSLDKVADGKIDYSEEAALEIIVDGLVIMAPSPGYAIINQGSTGVLLLNVFAARLEDFLNVNNIMTGRIYAELEQIKNKNCGMTPSIEVVLGDHLKSMTLLGNGHYQGEAPWPEQSSRKRYFDVNTFDNVWYNFHGSYGGSGLELFAIIKGLIKPGHSIRGETRLQAVKMAVEAGLLPQKALQLASNKAKEELPIKTAGFAVKDRIVELCTDVNGKNYFIHYDRTTSRVIVDEQLKANFNYDNTEFILPNPKDVLWKVAQIAKEYGSVDPLYIDVFNYIYTHVDLPKPILYHVATAFVLATWRREDWAHFMYLSFISQYLKGKTRALETLVELAYRGFKSSSISPAACYVLIEKYGNTIFFDEVEKLNKDDKAEIIAILNAGYKIGDFVVRVKPNKDGEYEPVSYNVAGFKLFASTESMKDTLTSRSVNFAMRDKTRRIPLYIDGESAQTLRDQLLMYRFSKLGTLMKREKTAYESATEEVPNNRIRELFSSLWMVLNDVTVPYDSPLLLINQDASQAHLQGASRGASPRCLNENEAEIAKEAQNIGISPSVEHLSTLSTSPECTPIQAKILEFMLEESGYQKGLSVNDFDTDLLTAIRSIVLQNKIQDGGEIKNDAITVRYASQDWHSYDPDKDPTKIGTKIKQTWGFPKSDSTSKRGFLFNKMLFTQLCKENGLNPDEEETDKSKETQPSPPPKDNNKSVNQAPLDTDSAITSDTEAKSTATIPPATLYYRPIQPPQTHQCSCQAYQATVSIVTEQGEESFLCQQCFDKSRESGTCYEHISQKPT